MDREIIDALSSLNLPEKEIKVYLALLTMGSSPVKAIREKTRLPRVAIYPLLHSLENKGFITTFIKEKIKFFSSIEPNSLIDILKEKELRIKNVLPKLNNLNLLNTQVTSAHVYIGESGIISYFDKIYSGEEKEVLTYGDVDLSKKELFYPTTHSRNLRRIKKIKNKIIVGQITNADKDYMFKKDYQKITSIFINPQLKSLKIYVSIVGNNVGFFDSSQNLSAVLINNREIAKFHKLNFNILLKNSKPISAYLNKMV